MLTTIRGTYRAGKIELVETPFGVPENTPVIITFLEAAPIDVPSRGIGEKQAADLRGHLAAFTEDWASPEMDVYDHYDRAKDNL
ncbi:MAG: hypothetical protein JXB30_14070 [Anaerolineae bacterium]|nr:hypothetical protein [Anaerolineae bacterium]